MNTKIGIFAAGSGVAVVCPTPEGLANFTIEELTASASSGAAFDIVERSAIPVDRTFRDAWEKNQDKTIGVNLAKAQAIATSRVNASSLTSAKKTTVKASIAATLSVSELGAILSAESL